MEDLKAGEDSQHKTALSDRPRRTGRWDSKASPLSVAGASAAVAAAEDSAGVAAGAVAGASLAVEAAAAAAMVVRLVKIDR